MTTTIKELHVGNSKRYRPQPQEKHATVRWEPASYQLSWGDQEFDGPHVQVHDSGGAYGVDLRVFFKTHEPVKGKADHYVKTGFVRAVQVNEPTEIHTMVDGRLEGTATVEPGGWVIQNPDGELYYNTPGEFQKRYEEAPETSGFKPKQWEQPPTLEQHLFAPGPKRILALDGGGIRGRISLGILRRIESLLGGPLCNHFDLIGGTSTGSIIAAGLSLGWGVDALVDLYDSLGPAIFEPEWLRFGFLRAKFSTKPLEQVLSKHFDDVRLGGTELKTGLAIVSKRLDTNSPWPLHNNPRGKYFGPPPVGRNYVPNGRYLVRQLVRASTAAPHYFEPEEIAVADTESGAFVDGGVSPHNNPALQLVLLATLEGYHLNWPLGADKLQVVSVGTGRWDTKRPTEEVMRAKAAKHAVVALSSLMDDCSALNELLMQWLSNSDTARTIDSEVGDLSNDLLGGQARLSYLRYDPVLDEAWLTQQFPELDFSDETLNSLRAMDSHDTLEMLGKIGDAAAAQVLSEHFA